MKRLTSALLASLLVGTLATGCELKLNTDTNTSSQTGSQTGNTGNTDNNGNTGVSVGTDTNVSTGSNNSTGNQNTNPDTSNNNSGSTSVACSTEEVNVAVGAEVNENFFCAYGPSQVKAGTKWVYVTNAVGTQSEMSVEFLNVTNDEVTVKTTVNGTSNTTTSKTNTATKPQTSNADAKFTFQGFEDVTVPAGTYKGAAKVMVSDSSNGADMDLTYWMAKGVGMVKLSTKTKVSGVSIDIPAVTTELKSFTP